MPDGSSLDWAGELRAPLSALRLDAAREAAIIDEISQHLDERYQELRADGSSEAEARHLVLEELRGDGRLAQRMQALARAHVPQPIPTGQPVKRLLGGLWLDVLHALRGVRRQPGFMAAIVVTLALGIAVNATVFTVINGAVLRPVPFDHVERIVDLGVRNLTNAQNPTDGVSYLDLADWRAARDTIEDIAATRDEVSVDVSGDGLPPSRVSSAYVSWNTFAFVGERPALGRDFTAADDRPGAAPVVLLGGGLWQSRYGGDPNVVGTTIRVAGIPSTVVGVMPRGFAFPYDAELWRPLAALPVETRESRDARGLRALGRLRVDATIEQATTELSGITTALAERYPDTNRATAPRVVPFRGIGAPIIALIGAMLGSVGFVLLIACANVANLLLALAAERSRDVTLRLALGASRWRVVRQLLVESLLLAGAGGVCGLALAYPGVLLVRRMAADPAAAPPYWVAFPIDGAVLGYLVVLCVGSALLCGLVPAWQTLRTSLSAALSESGHARAGSRTTRRWTGAFVVAQVALALVLVTGALQIIQSLVRAMRTDVGIEAGELIRMTFDLRASHDDRERRLLFLDQLGERLASSPGVSATLASSAPMAGAPALGLEVEGRPARDDGALPLVSLLEIGPGYFATVGAPILEGRPVGADDLRQGDRVVVNERFARLHFGDEPAIGRRIRLEAPDLLTTAWGELPPWMTIVGVAGNVRQRMLPSGEFDPVVYAPYAAAPPPTMVVLARAAAGPGDATAFVREQVAALDPDMPLFDVNTVRDAALSQFWIQRTFGSLLTAFALIAVVLATFGLYAVTAYAVSRRSHEIGVRVALGASGRRVWWTATGTTFRQLGLGIVLGTGGAVAISTGLPVVVAGAERLNPLVFAGVALALVVAGLVASTVPARRAMRVDPLSALQSE